ncbi:RNA-binding S4 domain-containing protein [uncultured Acetobacteroides sp.]|uniref:RNA-binding S4 domain-containing protein n=1 Tax=uncultured Acetobacteroides sp. TaxID=1760811 RepID=UPI0029F466FE|nr:RNA-binding S4 domain-containing protein [uncultured Acetobacteroides sp.]
MKTVEFALTKGDFIQLSQLLKVVNVAANGAEAGIMVDDGVVRLNGALESRKRAKIRVGDVVEVLDYRIYVK